jgi:hypothetical protein
MKKVLIVGIVWVFALVMISSPASAAEASADAYVGVYSKYLWRGFDLSEDDSFVVQPGTDVSINAFTVSFWANISENTGEMNEVDLTLDYSRDLGELVSFSLGNIFYNVDDADDTNELYVGVTLNTILEPSLTIYYDYDEFDGNMYTVAAIGHGLDLADNLSVGVGATASYLYDDELDDSWFHFMEVSANVDYAMNDNLSVGASALLSEPLSNDAEDYVDNDTDYTVGISVSYAF